MVSFSAFDVNFLKLSCGIEITGVNGYKIDMYGYRLQNMIKILFFLQKQITTGAV